MIQIRPAQSQDLIACTELLRALFTIEHDFIFDTEKALRGLQLLLSNENNAVLVAEDTAKTTVMGLCTVQTLISTAQGGAVGLLEDVIVHADYRRQGVASQLISSAEQWAKMRGLSRIQLLADKTNQPALAFYTEQRWHSTQLIALRKFIE